jgi:hypothetical protein
MTLVRAPMDCHAIDRITWPALGAFDLLQDLPGSQEIFVAHTWHNLRPALRIGQNVRIRPDVLNALERTVASRARVKWSDGIRGIGLGGLR